VRASEPEEVIYVITRLMLYWGTCNRTVALLYSVQEGVLVDNANPGTSHSGDIFSFLKSSKLVNNPNIILDKEMLKTAEKETRHHLESATMIWDEGMFHILYVV